LAVDPVGGALYYVIALLLPPIDHTFGQPVALKAQQAKELRKGLTFKAKQAVTGYAGFCLSKAAETRTGGFEPEEVSHFLTPYNIVIKRRQASLKRLEKCFPSRSH
jgi:hypothetical protein